MCATHAEVRDVLRRIDLGRLLPVTAALAALVFPVILHAATLLSATRARSGGHFKNEVAGIQVPFEFTKGHIFVWVSVNGKPGYVFLLDSGTSVDVLDLAASRELGIPIEKIRRAKDLGLGGGKVKMAGARHLNLELPSLGSRPIGIAASAAIVDLHGLSEVMEHRIDGILGYPLLRRYVVAINFDTDELILWRRRDFDYHGKGNVMQLVEHRDRVPAIPITMHTLNSKRRRAMVEIDTGSDTTLLLYPQYARRAHIDDAFFEINTKMKPDEGYGLGGGFPVRPAMFASMRMGRVLVSHFVAFMMQTSPPITRHRIAGVIGTSVLASCKRVIFDVPDREVIFELRPPPPLAQTASLGK